MKLLWKRVGSLILSVCMVATLLPMTALASEDDASLGLSNLCEHHEHTEDCYTDELTCGYVQDSGEPVATKGDAEHVHTQECYKLDCRFVCEDCNSALDTVMIEPENTVKAQVLAAASGTMSIHLTSGIPLDTDQSSTGWTWTASTATLTLKGYQGRGIILNCDYGNTINLVLVGASSVTSDGADGIFCKGNLKISGSGSLIITATGGYGISVGDYGTLSIHEGTVTASSSNKSAFSEAPQELPTSYVASWSTAAGGAAPTTANDFTWDAGFRYVRIETRADVGDTQITPAPISGVISPVVGNVPQTTIPPTDQYTTSIEWRDPSGTFGGTTFAPETVYRLQVVLSAKAGYTFAGLTADALKGFTVNGVVPSFTNPVSDTRCVIQVEFPATGAAPTVSGFSVERIDEGTIIFKFTPSTTGKWYYEIADTTTPQPENPLIPMVISSAGAEHIHQVNAYANATILYLQIEDESGNKSIIYCMEIPAYMPPNIVTTAAELKTALQAGTPETINVTADFTITEVITVGASHTLSINSGVTLTAGQQGGIRVWLSESTGQLPSAHHRPADRAGGAADISVGIGRSRTERHRPPSE